MNKNNLAIINLIRRCHKIVFMAGLFIVCFPAFAIDDNDEMDKLRLAFIFKLTKFVIWPDSSFDSDNSTIKLCLVGPNAFSLIKGQQKNIKLNNYSQGRQLELISFSAWQELQTVNPKQFCHLIYTDYIATPSDEFVSLIKKNDAILIGKNKSFVDGGGTMALSQQGGKLSIFLQQEWLEYSEVKLQSRLLRIIKLR